MEPYKQTNNLLDLGCSNGLFLEVARKRGWNVYGTEYAQESIDYCAKNNIKVFKSDQLPQEFFNLKFDVVTSFEVIEHINNPNEDMELVNKVIRKGGAFYFTTPNFNSLSRFILKEKWNVIDYPEHLSYYNPKSIHHLLSQHGYKKQWVLTTGISFTRFNQSLGKSTVSESTPVNDEALRDKIENNSLLSLAKTTINFFLNLFKIGDSLKGFYIKL
jgi:2-polyprenyl-3-methyl-5-hydroxy-6-metoxy-1,4-benzoquinol methylase